MHSIGLLEVQLKNSKFILIPKLITLTVLCFYFLHLPKDIIRYTKTGEGVIGIRNQESANHWNLDVVQRISKEIDVLTSKNETVFSLWPGYLFETHTMPVQGLENHFGNLAGNKLPVEERRKFTVLNNSDIREIMDNSKINIFTWSKDSKKRALKERILSSDFKYESQVGKVNLYSRSAN